MTWPYVDMSELETRVRRRADLSTSSTNPQFVSQGELQQYIQKSWEKLYNYLVGKYEDYFVKTASEEDIYEYTTHVVGIVPGLKDYNMPVDYFKLIKIELWSSTFEETEPGVWARVSDGDYLCTLKKLSWMQERLYVRPEVQDQPRYYILYGRVDSGIALADEGQTNGFRLVATPDTRYGIEMIYIPRAPEIPTIDESTDGLSFVNGWDEYVVTDATIKALDKWEKDPRVLQEERAEWLRTVEEAIAPRDAGQPHEVVAYPERGAFAEDEDLMELYRG